MQEQTTAQIMNNQAYVSHNILQLRLDTTEMIQNVKMFLSGEILTPEKQTDGSTKFVKQAIGDPISNKKGTQQLINFLQLIINPSVVQGNYEYQQYENHVNRIHSSLTRQLLVNYYEWGIKYDDLEMINDQLMHIIETFLSRLIDNKERESYAATLRSQESSRIDAGNKLLGLFGGGN